MYQAPSAPQPVGGVLDSGFALFRDSLKDTFLLALLSGLLAAPFSRMAQSAATGEITFGNAVTQLLVSLVSMVVTLFFYAAIIARIEAVRNGRHLPLGEAFETAAHRVPVVLGGFLLFMITVIVGLALLIIPGVYLMVLLGFFMIAAIVERQGVFESLQYSRRLVLGHWWRTAALLTIIGVIAGLLYLVLGLVVGIVMAVSGGVPAVTADALPWYVDYVVGPLLSSVVAPLGSALYIAVYSDLKLRREGGDIAERIAAAEA